MTKNTKAHSRALDAALRVMAALRPPGRCYSRNEIAWVCGCSHEAIRLIENAAIRKAQKKARILFPDLGGSAPMPLLRREQKGDRKPMLPRDWTPLLDFLAAQPCSMRAARGRVYRGWYPGLETRRIKGLGLCVRAAA